jgi:hypothetical protein
LSRLKDLHIVMLGPYLYLSTIHLYGVVANNAATSS